MRFTFPLDKAESSREIKCSVGMVNGPLAAITSLWMTRCKIIAWNPVFPLLLPAIAQLRQYGISDPILPGRGRRGIFWIVCGPSDLVEKWSERGLSVIEARPEWLTKFFDNQLSNCGIYYVPHVKYFPVSQLLNSLDVIGYIKSDFTIRIHGCRASILVGQPKSAIDSPFIHVTGNTASIVLVDEGKVIIVAEEYGIARQTADMLLSDIDAVISVGDGDCSSPCELNIIDNTIMISNCASILVPLMVKHEVRTVKPLVTAPWWLVS